jgi:outer membrane protein TolC
VEQAQAQVAAARRSVAAARTDAEGAFERSRLELRRAVAAEELAALQVERARLDLEQAVRRHNAGAISATALEEAALLLREAEGNARAAAHALGSAYLSLAVDLGFDLPQQLAAIAR